MGKVLVQTAISLDGFMAGPNHEMDWVFGYDSPPPETIQSTIDCIGAVIGGRRGYEVSLRSERPETRRPYGGAWEGPIFLATHNPPHDEPDPLYRFVSGDIRPIVEDAKAAAAGRDVLVLGANVAAQCFDAGLVDELELLIVPVLLGDGIRLFAGSSERRELELLDLTRFGATVGMRYGVVK
jgi:dihydrofolate reductase